MLRQRILLFYNECIITTYNNYYYPLLFNVMIVRYIYQYVLCIKYVLLCLSAKIKLTYLYVYDK